MTARLRNLRRSAATVVLLLSSSLAGRAGAESLQGALAKAYLANPTLTAARAEQRANDENVPIREADGRPRIGTSAQFQELVVRPSNQFLTPHRSANATGNIDVPLYQGGVVRNSVRAAKTRVLAGQANLRGTEATIFSRVVAAYMDVIRDSAIVSLNLANVNALSVNLQATNDRFEVGDLTRTDVAQSESRLALARSDLQTAEANLITSRENYIALVGSAPDDLQPPPPLPGLPASPDLAVQVALADNPDILAARKAREARGYDVKAAMGTVLPTVSAFSQSSYTDYLDSSIGANKQVAVGATVTLPLYQGGRPAAQVRQSEAFQSQAIEQEVEAERSVVAQTRSAYASWQAAVQTIQSNQKAVEAANLSLEGVRAENSVGSRTVLDILNAEQEALNAKVQLVSARRNAYVAAFSLLAAMGHAEAKDLNLETGALYDPMVNYERVKGKWFDWDFDPAPRAQATRTVDTPAQNANVPADLAQRP
ncbi:TolC family outer membrane protein [Sphingobium mellinum]|uniref:TolC family outer membrane protein n=1 Tax=Sphingobium mellinum TaxID=1387166 RepID=UPI0030EE2599